MTNKVLVADDDKNIRELYIRIFRDTDYSLTTAMSITQATRLIKANRFDLLITDLMFPDGLGTELIRLFKENRTDAQCLLVTGEPDVQKILESGDITEYFPKPFNLNRFMAAIKKVLSD